MCPPKTVVIPMSGPKSQEVSTTVCCQSPYRILLSPILVSFCPTKPVVLPMSVPIFQHRPPTGPQSGRSKIRPIRWETKPSLWSSHIQNRTFYLLGPNTQKRCSICLSTHTIIILLHIHRVPTWSPHSCTTYHGTTGLL